MDTGSGQGNDSGCLWESSLNLAAGCCWQHQMGSALCRSEFGLFEVRMCYTGRPTVCQELTGRLN